MKRFKRIIPILVICSMIIGLATSCSTQKIKTEDDESFATLEYWFGISGVSPPDLKLVNAEINKIIKDKINAEVILKPVNFNNYATTMSVKINSSDQFDMCYTSEWCNSYIENSKKGAFIELNDMLPQYAPTIWKTVGEDIWDAASVDGKIYGVVNTQIMPRQGAVIVRKDMADAFGLDISTIKKYEDLDPFLNYCKKNSNSNEIVSVFDMTSVSAYLGWDDFGTYNIPGVIKNDDPDLKVYNQFESSEFKNIMALGKKWYDNGMYNPDVLTATPDLSKICLTFIPTYKPGCEADQKILSGSDCIAIPFGEPVLYTSWILSSLNAISATSKNPVKSLQFLELLYSDKQLFNTLIYGIENKHYTKLSENRVETVQNTGYSIPSGWQFGNQFNQWLTPVQNDNVWDLTKEINDTAKESTAYGFIFDQTNVRTEMANCKAVYDEYWMALLLGLFGDDTDKEYNNFLNRLKEAGSEKIIVEKQVQLNEWKKSK